MIVIDREDDTIKDMLCIYCFYVFCSIQNANVVILLHKIYFMPL